MERPDPSLNQQFNEQYEKGIETIKERAIWRVGEQITELEQFRCTCLTCGYESIHQRIDIARHRLLFGRSIRQIEAARPMVHCQRCGAQRHTRDIDELVVPTTIRLHDQVQTELPPTSQRSSTLSSSLSSALVAFREEASAPLCRSLLADITNDSTQTPTEFLEAIGRELLLSDAQVADIIAARG